MRPSPVLYKLPSGSDAANSSTGLPYRSVFAVLTLDSVLVYDTHHMRPLSIARGLHYAGLTDCAWSSDGRNLIVSSTDGYVSILSFEENEFGEVYTPPKPVLAVRKASEPSAADMSEMETVVKPMTSVSPCIPPCEPGQTATIEGRPAKKAKTRITPTLVSLPEYAPTATAQQQDAKMAESDALAEEPRPKKKRIQPTLVSVNP